MKKLYIVFALLFIILFQFCTSTKKVQTTQPANEITYAAHIQPMIEGNCSPCHMPPQGNKKPLNSFAAVSGNIDEIISRVQKNPGDRGFMPFKHPKLPDSTIQVLVQWKTDSLLEN